MSVQVVLSEGVAHGDVGGGHVHFADADTPGSGRNGDHLIIFYREGNRSGENVLSLSAHRAVIPTHLGFPTTKT